MQVFKLFFKIARSKLGIMILYLTVFVALCFPMVHAGKEQTSFKETSLSLYIHDEDQTEASRRLIEELKKKNRIVELENDKQTILDAMYYQVVDYSLIIKEGYEERLGNPADGQESALFESYHMHDSYSVAMMDVFLADYVRNVRMGVATGHSLADAITQAEVQMANEIPVEIVADPQKEVKDENFTEDFAVFFRLLAYLFIGIIGNALCPVLLSINQGEKRKRIECSRVSVSSFISQTFAGSAVLVLVIWIVFMISGIFINGGMYKGINCWMAVANSFLYALMATLLAIFICSFKPGLTAMGMITQIVGLGMSFLCGAFVPQTMLDEKVLTVARILPAYWYVRANDILCGAQLGTMGDVWVCFGALAGFCVVFLVLTIVKSSRK